MKYGFLRWVFDRNDQCWPWDHAWFLSGSNLGPHGTGRLYRCKKCPALKARG